MLKSILGATSLALTLAMSPTVFADGHGGHKMAKSESPEGAKVYIISPQDGATVEKTFTVNFGLKGMGVAPAGTMKANTGHHHLLVDGKKVALDKPLGGEVKHFGGGQTETQLTLEPGKHTLQLILGDHNHVPHNPPVMSEVVNITVK